MFSRIVMAIPGMGTYMYNHDCTITMSFMYNVTTYTCIYMCYDKYTIHVQALPNFVHNNTLLSFQYPSHSLLNHVTVCMLCCRHSTFYNELFGEETRLEGKAAWPGHVVKVWRMYCTMCMICSSRHGLCTENAVDQCSSASVPRGTLVGHKCDHEYIYM